LISPSLLRVKTNAELSADIISNGNPIPFTDNKSKVLINETTGGLKRCGGQGDILSGAMGVMAAWAGMWAEGDYKYVQLDLLPLWLAGC
jgi:ATP-dependent NAD(P)H-hydrate dehydratase